ncbi:MAG: putative nitrogen fixation protein NifT [Gammaproteobacteria bacterium]|nr:putative nitrogen fixation protein NifT [Gammaproteobacteria bacterium]MCP5423973.1 putative nitrogen fixation protein NifT [Gammaproteobacteria bacterium]MCP5459452.1 putative nitrogen fixation protein NifT [Gammaproteobacteria bacterium]
MPNVMLRNNDSGELVFYLAKKDQEEIVVSIEHSGPESWGGEMQLSDGTRFYLEPFDKPPKLPITVRVRRL